MIRIFLVISFFKWLFGITSNHNYIISRSDIKYRDGGTRIDSFIDVDGYYHGSGITDNIILYRDGTIAHNVNIKKDILSGTIRYLFIPNSGGIYTISNDTIIAHVYSETGLYRYWHMSEYKYVIKDRNRIELVSRELIGPKAKHSELLYERQNYFYYHVDSISSFENKWKEKEWLWER